ISMTNDLPRRWILTGTETSFAAEAAPGEYFAFQIGVWADRQAIDDIGVTVTEFKLSEAAAPAGAASLATVIPASAATCFNTGGSNWDGTYFKKSVPVGRGKVQALWCGVQIPKDAAPGKFKGRVVVAPKGWPETSVDVELHVTGPALADAGDSDPFLMTRLRWLDSRLAFDDDIVPPYTPVKVEGRTVSCLGRALEVGPDGLPAAIRSWFATEMTRFAPKPVELLASPFRFRVEGPDGREIAMDAGAAGPRFTAHPPGAAAWKAESRANGLMMTVDARMEFDGFVNYKISLTADRDVAVSDIRLEAPIHSARARYMMGLGFKGGERPESFDWAWDRKKNQDALWLGTVNAGLQVSLRAENYSRPLNTNFYLSKPLNMPPSWWNDGRGTVTVRTARRADGQGAVVLLAAASGPRTIKAGETLHFDFTLFLTPFKLLDPAAHFSQRYFHAYRPLDEVAAAGANVVNIHHANEINPYINYPFLRPREMKAYIDEAHRRGFKVKIYDTVRELSNRAAEFFALRSLGHEVFTPGPGGGFSWLQEHLGGDYIAAWFVPDLKDAAVINSGLSRWHNHYIEGLDWLARNVGIDGLYLDDVAFDRTTMKRVRKVLVRRRPAPLIDLHSANQYNPRDGFASSANLYLEHFPFLDRLWFGEYFDYNGSGPDYWLVEMSGIPFGLMGEMLQDGGNPWRGMAFGMTSRLPWAGDPRPLWKAWDEFGLASSEMIGWWADSCPVKTGNKDVLATVYVKRGTDANPRALVALASWAPGPVDVRLEIDWKALGLSAARASLRAPAIDKFQPAAVFKPGDPVRVEPGKGWLLVLGD
ncbi:MAG: glycoside hydrolase domain-containing protein, partial [Acidobacteriota bacterium]